MTPQTLRLEGHLESCAFSLPSRVYRDRVYAGRLPGYRDEIQTSVYLARASASGDGGRAGRDSDTVQYKSREAQEQNGRSTGVVLLEKIETT